MGKVLTVTLVEFRQTVLSKAFLISIVIMPVLMGGMILINLVAGEGFDLKDRRVAVIDRTGVLFAPLEEKAQDRNREGVFRGEAPDKKQVKPKYFLEPVAAGEKDLRAIELELSERVDESDLYAFVIIGRDVLDLEEAEDKGLAYYSNTATDQSLPRWLEDSINEAIEDHRLGEAGIEKTYLKKLTRNISLDQRKLAEVADDGTVTESESENVLAKNLIPMAAMILLFVAVNMSSPMMLNTVIEEKMAKIAEVLVAAIPPFQLMLGKLFAGVLVGLTFAAVYLSGSLVFLLVTGLGGEVRPALYFWFLLFLVLSLFATGSIWAGIGAACNEVKDTQNFAALASIVNILPMFFIVPVLQAPNSTLSAALSFVPPLTPTLMLLRLATEPGPPTWQVLAGVLICVAFAVGCVWAAGRVFRIGLLAQGQSPGLAQIVRWILSR